MPIISRTSDNTFSSSMNLPSGSYHATQLAIAPDAMIGDNSIKVGIGEAAILKANSGGLLWTDSLQSCFPVIFKYSNGDIALYHGNNASIEQDYVAQLLNTPGLLEIQLFEKGTPINTGKVKTFGQNLVNHFEGKYDAPQLLIEAQHNAYNVAICQHVQEEPLILIGPTPTSGMSTAIDSNELDSVTPYNLIPVAEKYPSSSLLVEKQRSFKDRMSEVRVSDIQISVTQEQSHEDMAKAEEDDDESCCTKCVIQ